MSRLGVFGLLVIAVLMTTTAARGKVRPAEQPTIADLAIQRALSQEISVSLVDMSPGEVADYFESACGIQILLDHKSLIEGASDKATVTLQVNRIRAGAALRIALEQLDCAYVPRDGVLVITTATEAESRMVTRTYDVADLVWNSRYQAADFESMIELITTTLAPTSWEEVGGPGAIQEYESDGLLCLVISQTAEVHDDIADLLDSLRRTRNARAVTRRTPSRREAQKTRQMTMPAPRQRKYAAMAAWALPRTHE